MIALFLVQNLKALALAVDGIDADVNQHFNAVIRRDAESMSGREDNGQCAVDRRKDRNARPSLCDLPLYQGKSQTRHDFMESRPLYEHRKPQCG